LESSSISFRSVFIAVVIAFALILSAFLVNRARPKVETEQPTADFVRASVLGQAFVGVPGFWFHMHANFIEPGNSLFDKLVNGAPPMAPLLFPNLVGLALIGIWTLIPHIPKPGTGSSWLGSAFVWAHSEQQWYTIE
jgi:hypothetical protein